MLLQDFVAVMITVRCLLGMTPKTKATSLKIDKFGFIKVEFFSHQRTLSRKNRKRQMAAVRKPSGRESLMAITSA